MDNNMNNNIENVCGGSSISQNDFSTWSNYKKFKADKDSYEVSCPKCKQYIKVKNHHEKPNFSEYIKCNGCNMGWLIRRFNGSIQIQCCNLM